ncbi:kinase [Thraustotheca clavata]|uniref:Kinase n=1 Tax=Thraustotheca clavata TaxID=74557 RepID=A0A1V9YU89_9STRA|nr:kinase [Thraustotheca clavata]
MVVAGGIALAVLIATLIIRHRSFKSHDDDEEDSVLGAMDPNVFASSDHLFLSNSTPMMVSDTMKFGKRISPLQEGFEDTPFHNESDRGYRLLQSNELRLSRSSCPVAGGLAGSLDGEKVMVRRLDYRDRSDLVHVFVQRVGILSLIKHENVVELIGASKLSGISICAVFEHMEHGTLSSLLYNSTVVLSWQEQIQMCLDISMGLQYLHSLQASGYPKEQFEQNIYPLTSQLVLVSDQISDTTTSSLDCEHYKCKINIVACLDDIESAQPILMFGRFQLPWIAPEVASLMENLEVHPTATIFSLGIIFGEIVSRQRPYQALLDTIGPVQTDVTILDMYVGNIPNVAPHIWSIDVPNSFQQLVSKCLNYDPKLRPSIDQIIADLQAIIAARL